jgi:hypothetical protein
METSYPKPQAKPHPKPKMMRKPRTAFAVAKMVMALMVPLMALMIQMKTSPPSSHKRNQPPNRK